MGTSEGASDSRKVIQAGEILAAIEHGEPIEYDDVIVEGDLDLSGLDLLSEHVGRTWFEIEVLDLTEEVKVVNSSISITNSEIRGNVVFSNAIFRKSIDFTGTNFSGDDDFHGSEFSDKDAYFREAVFSGEYADFSWAKFSGGNADFDGAVFSGGDADFNGAVFSGGYANFYETEFSGGDAYFDRAEFSSGGAYFMDVVFSGGDADFDGAEFSGGDADFNEAEFSGGDADFDGAEFSGGDANFYETEFSGGDAEFQNAEFSGGDADFRWAEFSGSDADFSEAVFSGSDASFSGAVFSGGDADFSEAVLSGGDANFYGAEFSGGDANFWNAMFSGGDADFSWEEFSGGYAIFLGAQFSGGDIDFFEAKFGEDAYFENTIFGNSNQSESFNVSLSNVRFGQDAYFENATFYPNTNLDLTRSFYKRMFLPWDRINQNQASPSDDDAYLALMRNYMNLGWYEDANSCYYEYRNKRRAAEDICFEKVTDTAEWALYGYGMKPLRTAGWIVGLVLLFGLVFRNGDSIKKYVRKDEEEIIKDETAEQDDSEDVELKTTLKRGKINFKDPFLFSLATFTSGLTSFLYPTIEYRAEKHTRLVIIERLLGSVFLALLITAITKTWLIR